MSLPPVIERELRAQARQPVTYIIRFVSPALVLVTMALLTLNGEVRPAAGSEIFRVLHIALAGAIWILAPLGACDCISRERREGTLGLLFLTPLTARDIVLAKIAVHGLRSVGLWLAALPVLVIAFLLGGVSQQQVICSCFVDLSLLVLLLPLSALVSSFCQTFQRSQAVIMPLTLVVTTGLSFLTLLVAEIVMRDPSWPKLFRMFDDMDNLFMAIGGVLLNSYEYLSSTTASQTGTVLLIMSIVFLFSLLGGAGLISVTAWNVRRCWREPMRSARLEKWEGRLGRPVVSRSWMKQWLRHRLERNPVGWLEQRTWSARLGMWGWLAATVLFYCTVFSSYDIYLHNFIAAQTVLFAVLMLSLMMTAAGSFRRERENGMLELILVSPLRSGEVISGRVQGLWGQIAPAVGLWLAVWLFTASFQPYIRIGFGLCMALSFFTIPIVGLYYSLAKASYMSSFFWTLLMGGITPVLANLPLVRSATFYWLWVGTQIVLAVGFAFALRRNLEERSFALKPVTA